MYVAPEHQLLQHYNLKFIKYNRSTRGTHQCSGILTANDLHLHIRTRSRRHTLAQMEAKASAIRNNVPVWQEGMGGGCVDGRRAELYLPGWDFVEVTHPPEEAAGHKEQRETWEMSYWLSARTTDVWTAQGSADGVDWNIRYVARIQSNTLPFSLWQWNENPIGSSK